MRTHLPLHAPRLRDINWDSPLSFLSIAGAALVGAMIAMYALNPLFLR